MSHFKSRASFKPHQRAGESVWVQAIKIVLLSVSECVYTWELCNDASRYVVLAIALIAGILAGILNRGRVRLIWIISIGVILSVFGGIGAIAILNGEQLNVFVSIGLSRMVYYGALAFGVTLVLRSLSLRYQVARLVESCVTLGALVFVFFSHRDMNLQNPREFADWAYGSKRDPIELYRYMGVGAAFLSLAFWLGRAKFWKVFYSFLVLALMSLALAQFSSGAHLAMNVEDPLGVFNNEDENESGKAKDGSEGGSNDDNDDSEGGRNGDNDESEGGGNGDNDDTADSNGGGGGNGSNNDNTSPKNPPTPVAVAVFYDEFEPADGIFHFRQSVLSKYDGNHLVNSEMDSDVISKFPYTTALEALPLQSESVHKKVQTSMFLLQDHMQPPQVAMGQRVFPIDNPDPKLFVAAYGVDSLGLSDDVTRFLGRKSVPSDWSEEKKEHYLKIPDDPRYKALSDIIVRHLDPRFYGEDIAKAIIIKSWLEHEGYYTLKTKHIDPDDPTASFLFGSLRGYCVHFAHSAVYLLRSQGIAARVAIGYAVDNQLRGTNSAVLIRGNMGHAWPEIYIDGVGWATFDIFPENGDPQPSAFVDQSLESLFGELARKDKSGGKSEEPVEEGIQIPWAVIWMSLLGLLSGAVIVIYTRKVVIIVRGSHIKKAKDLPYALRSVMKVWDCCGQSPEPGETLEHFAKSRGEATLRVVDATLAQKLGGQVSDETACDIAEQVRKARKDAFRASSISHRILAIFHP